MKKMKRTSLKMLGTIATVAFGLVAAVALAFGMGKPVSAESDLEKALTDRPVWLGSTQVTPENMDDIFGDGKAKLIPYYERGVLKNYSLILDNPKIEGNCQVLDDEGKATGKTCKIYYNSPGCPSIYGCYHMDLAEADYGLYAMQGCWLYGDYSFIGNETGMYSNSWLKFNENYYNPVPGQAEKASIYAEGGTYGITVEGGWNHAEFSDQLSRVEVKGGTEAMGNGSIRFLQYLDVTYPENGFYDTDYRNVYDVEGVESDHFVLEPATGLWVGGTQVTEENKDDILEDGGKAKFDFDTGVLTLDYPVIDGFYEITEGSTATIYSRNMDLTIKGNCSIDAPNVRYGIEVYRGTLTLDGNFSIVAGDTAIMLYSYQLYWGSDLYIEGGSLYAESSWSAINGDSDIVIGNKVRRVECIATEPDEYNYAMGVTGVVKDDNGECVHKIIVDPSLVLVTPEDGVIDHNLIYKSDHKTFAMHVLFEHPCTVSYDMDGVGTAPESQTVQYGDTIKKPEDPSVEGYVFKGWFADEAFEKPFSFDDPITDNTTIIAKWAKLCNVGFEMNGHGTAPEAQIVEAGNKAKQPAEPSAEGFSFGGWYADKDYKTAFSFEKAIKDDTTVYAKWLEIFSVKVDGKEDGTIVEGETLEKPADPKKDGSVFKGWYSDEALTKEFDFTKPVEGNVTLYPKWAKICHLTLNLSGGTLDGKTGSVDVEAEEGSTYTMPLPTREGFEFTYWSGSKYYSGDSYEVAGDHTFTAMWKEIVKTTTDDQNGSKTANDQKGAPATGTDSVAPLMVLVAAVMFAGLGLMIGKGRARRV